MGSAPSARPGGLPTPRSFHTCSLCPPPGASSQSLLLGGFTYLLLTGSVSLSCSGITRKAYHSEAGSASRHQGSFPGSHSPPARPLSAQTQKSPLGPEPHGSAWAPTPSCLVRPSHVPCRSPGAPTCPRQAVCSVLGRPPWCQVEDTGGTMGPPSRSTVASTHLLTSSLWMDRGSWGPQHLLVLISSQHCPQGSC